MASNVEILGIENLKFALENVEKKLRTKAVKDALKLGAEPVAKQMRKNVPVLKTRKSKTKTRTRGLVRSRIKVRTSSVDRRKKDIGVFVNVKPAPKDQRGARSKTDPFYWKFIKYGCHLATERKKTKKENCG